MDARNKVIAWALLGFALALLPASAWIFIDIAILALVFALGLWAVWKIIAGMVRASGAFFKM